MNKPVIICVDDEKTILDSLRMQLASGLGDRFVIEVAQSAKEGIELFKELTDEGLEVPLVITDHLMPGMRGDEMLIEIHKMDHKTRKILLTGQASQVDVLNVLNQGGLYRYIGKPWEPQDLLLTVEEAVKSFQLDRDLATRMKMLADLNLVAQVLSEEVNPDRLLNKLMAHLLRDLEAHRAYFLVFRDNVLYSAVFADYEKGSVHIELLQSLDTQSQQHPTELLRFAATQGEPLSIQWPTRQQDLKTLPYFQTSKAKAAYAAPIIKGERRIGLVYLEHDGNHEHFSHKRTSYLSLLLKQAAISIDNALLYEGLEQRVADRTQIIQEQNEEIRDSIRYARRIQQAILPSLGKVKTVVADHFVLYRPKDIVSGDFYWMHHTGQELYLAAVDCTGHGVPGAFMSVMASSMLSQIMTEGRLHETHDILNELHRRLVETLQSQSEDGRVLDGMDMAIVRLNVQNRALQFAGANRPLYVLHSGDYEEYPGNRLPIGGAERDLLAITSNRADDYDSTVLKLEPGDAFFLFTDGATDQFGGPKNRKFTRRRLLELLRAHHNKPMAQQAALINAHLQEWQGSLPQTDDILVMGVRV